MHNQLLHEDIAQLPPTPPTTRLDPCVSTVTTGAQLIDFMQLYVRANVPLPAWATGERIGEASYKFQGVPHTFPPSRLHATSMFWQQTPEYTIDTWQQLATAHWHRLWLSYRLKVTQTIWFTETYPLCPFAPPYTATAIADTYSDTFIMDGRGEVTFSVSFTIHTSIDLSFTVPAFSCPPNTNLKLYLDSGWPDYLLWQGGRYPDGTYWP